MRIVVIGAGHVGGALAERFAGVGHEVVVAPRGQEQQALAGAEAVVLAVPFPAVHELLPRLADDLAGTVLIDCTNPVGPGLTHGLGSVESGSQVVARLAPAARVVKAFSIYGWENLADNAFEEAAAAGVRPTMMLAGDDADANALVADLAEELGWEPLVVGGLPAALQLEHMTLLWVRMVRQQGRNPHLVWAKLERSG